MPPLPLSRSLSRSIVTAAPAPPVETPISRTPCRAAKRYGQPAQARSFPPLTWIAPLAIVAALVASLWLYRTHTGLQWRIVGESFQTARLSGARDIRCSDIFLGIRRLRHLLVCKYRETYNRLLTQILDGPVSYIDETEIKLKDGEGYVMGTRKQLSDDYMFCPSREGGFLRQMNRSIPDIPFDEEVQSITAPFGVLLSSIVTTIDRHGLKQRRPQTHIKAADGFLGAIEERVYESEASKALQQRLLRNRERLFTFLHHDGVSWNDNLAENANKHVSTYRDDVRRSIKAEGLSEHLVLLSLFQSRRVMDISFLKFLLSQERDMGAFAMGKRRRRKGELDRQIDRLITNISKGADFDLYNPKVNELAAERKRVEAELFADRVGVRACHRAPGCDRALSSRHQAPCRYRRGGCRT